MKDGIKMSGEIKTSSEDLETEELSLTEIKDSDLETESKESEQDKKQQEKSSEEANTKNEQQAGSHAAPKRKKKVSFLKKLLYKFQSCIPAALFFSFMMGFFGPVQLFITNSSEFYFELQDILPACIKVSIISFAAIAVVTMILPEIISRWLGSLVFGLSLALYIQGNYVTTNYGSLNGESIDWSSFGSVPIWNTAIWCVCILVPIIITAIKPKISRLVNMLGSIWIVAIQVVTLVVLMMNIQPKVQNNIEKIFSNYGKYELSSNENVIVFVLDCYESGEFANLLETHSEYKESLFNNFTYYPNTVGGSTRTVLALPQILTGKPYIDEKPYEDYLNDSYKSTELYDKLNENGYENCVYTESNFAPSVNGINIDNLYDGQKKVTNYDILSQCMYKFTACRYFPHILKKYVWMYSGEFDKAAYEGDKDDSSYILDDAAFYKGLCEKKLSLKESNEFKLYHLNGAHPPYTLTSDATQDVNGTDLYAQQEGVMLILQEYMNQMQELGVYDNSTIIICADHGADGLEYNPVFLIKDKMNTQEFTVSNAPVSYENLQPTILAALGVNDTGIKSVWDLTEDDNEERYFYHQETNENKAVEYIIKGVVKQDEEVTATGKTYDIFKTEASDSYELGTKLDFNLNGTANAYVLKGLSKLESDYTCTNGNELVISIPLDYNDSEDLYFEINCYIIFGRQRIGVTVNDKELNWYDLTENTLRFVIPADYVSGKGKLDITLELPDADEREDEGRSMSMAMYNMVIDKVYDDIQTTPVLENVVDEE